MVSQDNIYISLDTSLGAAGASMSECCLTRTHKAIRHGLGWAVHSISWKEIRNIMDVV